MVKFINLFFIAAVVNYLFRMPDPIFSPTQIVDLLFFLIVSVNDTDNGNQCFL